MCCFVCLLTLPVCWSFCHVQRLFRLHILLRPRHRLQLIATSTTTTKMCVSVRQDCSGCLNMSNSICSFISLLITLLFLHRTVRLSKKSIQTGIYSIGWLYTYIHIYPSWLSVFLVTANFILINKKFRKEIKHWPMPHKRV